MDKSDPNKPPKTFEEAVERLTDELRDLMVDKQRSYGKENILEFGELGVLIRASDKRNRLKNLLYERPDRAGKAMEVESMEDNWKDWANYAIIALMLRRKWWGLPLSEDVSPASPYSEDSGSNDGDSPMM